MTIPESLLKSLEAAGRRERDRRRADESRDREIEDTLERDLAGIPDHERARVALAVWTWLGGPEAVALKQELRRAGLARLRLIGPVRADSGVDADDMPTGCLVLSLVASEPGVHLNYRMGAAWGAYDQIQDLERFERYVPFAPLYRLHSLIESGELWSHLERMAAQPH